MKLSDIPGGKGMDGHIDEAPVAVYNSGDELMVFENVCTHMGCQTHWNEKESTWDCPCHGSKYSATGEVIDGPAPAPLARISFHIEDGEIRLG